MANTRSGRIDRAIQLLDGLTRTSIRDDVTWDEIRYYAAGRIKHGTLEYDVSVRGSFPDYASTSGLCSESEIDLVEESGTIKETLIRRVWLPDPSEQENPAPEHGQREPGSPQAEAAPPQAALSGDSGIPIPRCLQEQFPRYADRKGLADSLQLFNSRAGDISLREFIRRLRLWN